jgi:hypothetical protein
MKYCGNIDNATAALIARGTQFGEDLRRYWAREQIYTKTLSDDMQTLLGNQFENVYADFTGILRQFWSANDSTVTLNEADSLLQIAFAPLPTTPTQYMIRYANYREITVSALLDSILAEIEYLE